MKVVALSDMHGMLYDSVPECDLLLIAGDVTPHWNHHFELQKLWLTSDFKEWLERQPAKHIVGTAGNHDWALQKNGVGSSLPWHYLKDSYVVLDGVKIHGSPYSRTWGSWAFQLPDNELIDKWNMIHSNVDILMVHGPAYAHRDNAGPRFLTPGDDPHVGSKTLLEKLANNSFPKLKHFIFGHTHDGYGEHDSLGIHFVNSSHMTEDFRPVNPPIVFDL